MFHVPYVTNILPSVSNRFIFSPDQTPGLTSGVSCLSVVCCSITRPSFSPHLLSFDILRVRGAWSSRGAMYPNHISTRANPEDSWGIFTAQLKHELDSSFIAHLCEPPRFHQPAIVTPTPTHSHRNYN